MTFYPPAFKPITLIPSNRNNILWGTLQNADDSWDVGYIKHSDLAREVSILNLCIPFLNPAHRAQTLVDSLIPFARRSFLPFAWQSLTTTVEVKVVLITVSCLVGIWKPWIEWSCSVVLDLLINSICHLESDKMDL